MTVIKTMQQQQNGYATATRLDPAPSSTPALINGGLKRPRTKDTRSTKKYKHTFAVHQAPRTSCLTHNSATSPSFPPTNAPNFFGFRNLMGLVLVASNLRLMIENFNKYGLLVTLSGSQVRRGDWQWFGFLYGVTPVFLFVAYAIEAAAAVYAKEKVGEKKKAEVRGDNGAATGAKRHLFSTWRVIAFCHGFNATLMLVIATYTVYFRIHNPGLATFAEIHAVIVWLKVCSRWTAGAVQVVSIPAEHHTEKSQLLLVGTDIDLPAVYPMTDKRRWDFIAKRACESLLLSVVIFVACAQYAVPLLQNSLNDISTLHLSNILERVLKLSTISLVCWLAGFFAVFQSFLNMLAEIMMFGDREFYSDWWNSSDLRGYWTSWNKPVTHFMKRHIYSPMVGRGIHPVAAQLITFTFSGILHELLIGVPTHNILGVAFMGMMLQIPLIFLTDPLSRMKGHNGKLAGNLIFWISFCFFGQPLAALIYFFAWQAKYGTDNRPQWPLGLGNANEASS
ncbi:diacylglycerol O-acyltransferase 1-2-like [Teratosphaeria destructans]|uniref:O-acyltransferase n=1 Tax=Teratosphaeria destructans TaxID=418781 RepID=A0A9W7SNS9_9PEZI|nr:diacylglycerol O-acyltransferase 1-2-like [Teratosphaeria destructans]